VLPGQNANNTGNTPMNEAVTEKPASIDTARMIYILYLIGIAVGLTALVGLIMAYVNKDEAPDWLKTHYQFQIRTFWISMLYGFIGFLLIFAFFIGILVIAFVYIWLIVRCVKGMKALDQRAAVANPTGWGF
jgi:uncharacterized membrane protein